MRTDMYNILVADDEEETVDSLKHFLASKGFNVNGVANGQDALKYIEQNKTDILLLDLRMPGMHGKEVARLVKAKYPLTKILVITAFADDSQEITSLAESILKKPIELEELHKKLLDTLLEQDSLPNQVVAELPKQSLRTRTLFIKAKLLFVEPSPYIYNCLHQHFKVLASRGEYYEVEQASNFEEVKKIFTVVHPDIFLINTAFFDEKKLKDFLAILASDVYRREIITYKISSVEKIDNQEVNRLIRDVETFCLMNGLIDIQWKGV